jgi:hypothetical protein
MRHAASSVAGTMGPTRNIAKRQTKLCSYWMHQLQMVLVLGTSATNVAKRQKYLLSYWMRQLKVVLIQGAIFN